MLSAAHCRTIAVDKIVAALCAWLAIACLGAARDAHAIDFPFGVYDKTELAPGSDAWRAHYERLMSVLVRNHVNTIIVQPYKDVSHTLYVMDLARTNGIQVVMTVGNPLNPAWDYAGPSYPFYRAYKHPSVIAYKYGDEPDDAADLQTLRNAYAALRLQSRLPIVTAMVGENMDFAPDQFATTAWSGLRTQIRFARHYPLRRVYDLDDWYRDKMQLPYPEWARRMEECCASSWWLIAQTFGKGIEKSDASFWRLPTAAELSAMVHIALAHGASGIFGYALQDHDGQFQGLTDEHLTPRRARDGSIPLVAFADLGLRVRRHSDLLSRLQRSRHEASTRTSSVVAVPRIDPSCGDELVYLVNLDAENPVSTIVRTSTNVDHATSVFAPSTHKRVRQDGTFDVDLAPGEGQLWRFKR